MHQVMSSIPFHNVKTVKRVQSVNRVPNRFSILQCHHPWNIPIKIDIIQILGHRILGMHELNMYGPFKIDFFYAGTAR